MSASLPRRHLRGKARVDERAVFIEGHLGVPVLSPQPTAECYYYILQNLDTVAAVMKQNGNLCEGMVYAGYGRATTIAYPRGDFNRDGHVTTADVAMFLAWGPPSMGTPTPAPAFDLDLDGDRDLIDMGMIQAGQHATPERVSMVGNPFAFTGRRLIYYETEPDPNGEGGVTLLANEQLQFNRHRWYDLETSRWLTRDPKGYVDGMSLYEYCQSNPAKYPDPMGTESIEDEKGWLAYLNDDGFSWRFGRKLGDGNVLIDHPYWPLAFRMSESAATSALDPWFSSHEFSSIEQIMLFFSGMALNPGERGQISLLDKRSGRAAWTPATDFDASEDEDLAAIGRAAQRMSLSEVASLTAKSYGWVYGALTVPAGNGAMAVDLLDTAVETGRSGWSARTTTTVGAVGAAVVLHMASSRSGRGVGGGAADEADDAWRARMRAGREFDGARRAAYPFNELYVHNPAGGYFKVDSYNPRLGEIVSRKSTQFAAIRESTGINYIRELARKYSPGTQIADVPTSGALAGDKLRGRMILEVPVQTRPIPQAVLEAARRYKVIIRDEAGNIYR